MRKLRNEELRDVYSPNIIRVIRSKKMGWAERVTRLVKNRNAYWLLVCKPEGKRSLENPRRR